MTSGISQILVNYSIWGSFNGGPAQLNPSLTFGSGPDTATIQFNGVNSASSFSPSFINTGTFQSTATGLGATVPGGTTFTFFIFQTTPATDMGSITGDVVGTIDTSSSTGEVDFVSHSVTLSDNATWTVPQNLSQAIPSPLSPPFTVQGIVSVVPEPQVAALAGAGLLLVSLWRRIGRR